MNKQITEQLPKRQAAERLMPEGRFIIDGNFAFFHNGHPLTDKLVYLMRKRESYRQTPWAKQPDYAKAIEAVKERML